jgi:dolichol kinase
MAAEAEAEAERAAGAAFAAAVTAALLLVQFAFSLALPRGAADPLELRRKASRRCSPRSRSLPSLTDTRSAQLQHASTGVAIAAAAHAVSARLAVSCLLFACALIASLHVARRRHARLNAALADALRGILRPPEARGDAFPAGLHMLLGCALVYAWAPRRVALLAVLCVSVGDPAAALVGAAARGARPGAKSLEGSLACFAACALAAAAVVATASPPLAPAHAAAHVAVVAAAAAAAEARPGPLNDNLAMPLAVAAAEWALARALPAL